MHLSASYASVLVLFVLLEVPCAPNPVVSASWGTSGLQRATAVAVDAAGNSYIVGWTDAADFPVRNTPFARGGGVDAFLIKLDPAWNVLYATYLGGAGDDRANAIGLDSGGNIFVAGTTTSTVIAGALFSSAPAQSNGFLIKLDPTGQHILYALAIGGSRADGINAMAVQSDGHVIVAGETSSVDLPVQNAVQATLRGIQNGFVEELDPSGSTIYCTYLGGNGSDQINAVAVDSSGAAWVAGGTTSSDFPLVAPFQSQLGGLQNAFVSRFSAAGSILYSTYLGGSGATGMSPEQANAIALDLSGNVYVAGITSSTDFPVVNAVQASMGGWGSDAFLSSFTSSGVLRFSTYLGGSGIDCATSVAILDQGPILVSGYTASSDFPLASNLSSWHSGYNAFVAGFALSGTNLLFSSYADLGQWDAILATVNTNPPISVGEAAATDPPQVLLASAQELSIPEVLLTTAVEPPAAGTIATVPAYASGTYPEGSMICLTATANAGWLFRSWTGAPLDASNCLIVNGNASVTAVFAEPLSGDFNGDGVPDLIWQSISTSEATVHYYGGSGGSVDQGFNWIYPNPVSGWRIVAIADFNRDGHLDIVWQQSSTREATVHYLGGPQGDIDQGYNWLYPNPVSGWHIVGAADFNGDGIPDIVWQNDATRQATVHYMGGVKGNIDQGFNWVHLNPVPGWSIVGIADFNGDGIPDIVWQNDSTRQVTVHYMGGSQGNIDEGYNWLYPNPVSGWHVVGAVDMNGDGHPDIIWQSDTTGQATVHYFSGAQGNVELSWTWLNINSVPDWKAIVP